MAPVLFDQRRLFSAGMTIILGMLVVFVGGYYLGYQKADSGRDMGLNTTMALALPKPAHADTAHYEPYTPETQLPGANIDVDIADDAITAIEGKDNAVIQAGKVKAQVEAVIYETTTSIETPAASATAMQQNEPQLQLASLDVTHEVLKTDNQPDLIEAIDDSRQNAGNAQQLNDGTATAKHAGAVDTATAENARYTIQVGVYADSNNALRRKSELESQQLSAYIQAYSNKRDEQRFNVRFGYFKDKSSAVAALDGFEQNMSGSGYVTRIRRN